MSVATFVMQLSNKQSLTDNVILLPRKKIKELLFLWCFVSFPGVPFKLRDMFLFFRSYRAPTRLYQQGEGGKKKKATHQALPKVDQTGCDTGPRSG